MISQESKQAITQMLTRCLNESLAAMFPQVGWELKTLSDAKEIARQEFFMVTISSYEFRVLVMLHFTRDENLANGVASTTEQSVEELEQKKYYDYLGEVSNMFCGAIKRELGKSVAYLGMSVPNALSSASLEFVDDIAFDYDTHVVAHGDNAIKLFGSMYVFGDLDVRVLAKAEVEEIFDTGELELF